MPTQNLGNGLRVSCVRVDAGESRCFQGTSKPLMDGDTCHVAGESALVSIDLRVGKVASRVSLPNPDIVLLVLEGQQLATVTGSYADAQWLSMDRPGILSVVRHLPTRQNWSNCIRLEVDLASQSTTAWERTEPPVELSVGESPSQWSVQFGDSVIESRGRNFLLTATSEGAADLALRGDAEFIVPGGDNRALVMTNQRFCISFREVNSASSIAERTPNQRRDPLNTWVPPAIALISKLRTTIHSRPTPPTRTATSRIS